jgi:hypothetical protein
VSRFSVLVVDPVGGLLGLEELLRPDLPMLSLVPLLALPLRLVFPLRISRWLSGELLIYVGGREGLLRLA